ncbi:uncharacterized protein NFIA_107760 [Aspergillus fischeri NRRL 181]|uniref:Uncharacterized protein n=1 Tax=Neosartorya fischeri (strain ATCC 1020 / DSM 3700 / CBS 544.65 / FGSC A1164 / JCM 1740 / NRRL 181 / WB 181) TaxID=331117 RepID=A1CXD2_NEOFI|nr:uncharacterized protein NFIA_107760 [Aspergillus fischeri NRRL 181]EAW25284.1 hypothetical protein NFIA_107760 [Aspergillus fischeri NRRL 181]
MVISRDTNYSGHVESDHASSTSTDGSGSGSSSNVTAIIIGVVVGGVAAIAITAGILFFLYKKRRWDRIRRREEQLLEYDIQAGLKSEDAELATMRGRPSSSLSVYRAHSDDISDRPPAYQTLHVPVYDPSRYRDINVPPAVQFSAMRQPPLQPADNAPARVSSQFRNQPVSHPNDDSPLPQLLQPPGPVFRGTSPDSTRDSIQSDSLFQATVAPADSSTLDRTARLPRRPKPVLSRLITNLN